MRPNTCLVKHDPANGKFGDCTRCCIAALLDLPPEAVPHFFETFSDLKGSAVWQSVDDYLRTQGLAMTHFCSVGDVEDVLRFMGTQNPSLYWMMGVASPNADHSVVCRGGEVVCDPSGYVLTQYKPCSDGMVWINVLVPISMTQQA